MDNLIGKTLDGLYTVRELIGTGGSLLVGIDAYRVDVREKENEITVEVEYALEINNEHLADCHIRILANPKQNPAFKLVK